MCIVESQQNKALGTVRPSVCSSSGRYAARKIGIMEMIEEIKEKFSIYDHNRHEKFNAFQAYIPGVGLYYYDDHPDLENGAATVDSAAYDGVDCIGMAQRSVSYSENFYSWPQFPQGLDHTSAEIPRAYPYAEGSGLVIQQKPKEGFLQNLHLVRPGDIFFYMNADNTEGAHIAVVNKVNVADEITADDIELIEATFESNLDYGCVFSKVINSRELSLYTERKRSERNWYIVRLNH